MGTRKTIMIARFWSKVDVGSRKRCWPWKGSLDTHGYGSFTIGKRKVIASRFAWQFVNQKRLCDLLACHHCDNRKCCNPNHIYPGTRFDNARDAAERGGLRNVNLKGSSNPRAKLTEDDVDEIRHLLSVGVSQVDIASSFNVSTSLISDICTGKKWSHHKSETVLP